MVLPVFQRTVVNSNGDVIPSAQITVIDENTGVAPAGGIFSDRAGTVPLGAGGVFSTGADGFAQFYAAKGTYRVTALDLGTALSQTWRYVVLSNSDMYYPDNILGPVSQSGGVPTGAIVQRGENANGEFVRFADGTVFMLLADEADVNITTPEGALFGSNSPVKTLPTAVIPGTLVGYINDVNSQNIWGNVLYLSSTSITFRALFYSSISNRTIRTFIFARWY